MAELFTNQLDNNIDVITKMNNRGYSLTGSYSRDRKIINNIVDTKREYITSGNFDKTNAYIDSKTKHTNVLDNITDMLVGGHGKAKEFDKKIESGVEYISDTYNEVTSVPKYLMYAGIAFLVLYILKK